jgi:hypothetical protein
MAATELAATGRLEGAVGEVVGIGVAHSPGT